MKRRAVQVLAHKKKRYVQTFGLSESIPFFDESTTDLKERTLTLNISKFSTHLDNMIARLYPINVKVNCYQNKDIGESAILIADFLSNELENSNANFKRALKGTFRELKMTNSIRGIRINCSGRLGKAPMAKTEWFKYGQIPLSKMNANLSFAKSTAHTKYGTIGTKDWVYYYD